MSPSTLSVYSLEFNLANPVRLGLDGPQQEYWAVDLERPQWGWREVRPPHLRFVHADACTVGFRRDLALGGFDVVTSVGVLGWVPLSVGQAEALLWSARQLVAPEGVFAVKLDEQPMRRFAELFRVPYRDRVVGLLQEHFEWPPVWEHAIEGPEGFAYFVLRPRPPEALPERRADLTRPFCAAELEEVVGACAGPVMVVRRTAVGAFAQQRRWQVLAELPCSGEVRLPLVAGDCAAPSAGLAVGALMAADRDIK